MVFKMHLFCQTESLVQYSREGLGRGRGGCQGQEVGFKECRQAPWIALETLQATNGCDYPLVVSVRSVSILEGSFNPG